MSLTVRLEGFAGLEEELAKVSKAVGKGAVRRALKKSAEPMAEIARGLAPDDPATGGNDLKSSIAVSAKLSVRQAKMHRRMFRDDRAAVEMFVGAGVDPAAHTQEFGTINHGPQPFMRPAWDQDQTALLERLGTEMWAEIQKSVARAQARAAKRG